VSDLVYDSMTKPKSDNMSMDEILASIRKIIASDHDDTDTNKVSNQYSNSEYTKNENQSIKVDDSRKEPKSSILSAREQLVNLTKSTIENDNSQYSKRPVYQKISQEIYNSLDDDASEDKSHQKPKETHHEYDDEILRALNEIRHSLTQGQGRLNIQSQNSDNLTQESTFQKTQTNPIDDNIILQQGNKNLNHEVQVNMTHAEKENIINDIDLKPVQFSSDDVPKFLKNFKNQQIAERTQNMKQQGTVNYDFSAVPKFDEPSDVMILTETVMPKKSSDMDNYDTDILTDIEPLKKENNLEKTVSKLRHGTEEIMRRATERTLTESKELNDGDAPFSALIIRTLKPMLQEWINKNMQEIAEEVLRDEFRRGLT
jgi:cell pole-organizing protein PopZ